MQPRADWAAAGGIVAVTDRPRDRAGAEEWSGWQRNVGALALIVFTAFVGFNFVSPFLPLYIHDLGVEDPAAVAIWSGFILAVTPGIAGLLSPFWGQLADRYGRRPMLIRSLAGFVIIMVLMGLVTSVIQLLILRIIMGFFAGFAGMAMALASVSCPREKVPVAIGLVQSAQLISVAIGPAAGGYVASHFGIRYAFMVTALLCIVALAILMFLFREVRQTGDQPGKPAYRRLPLAKMIAFPFFPVLLVLLFSGQTIDRGLSLLVPLRVAQFSEVNAVAMTSGIIIAVAAVVAATSANVVARLANRIPIGLLLLAAFVTGGTFCFAAAFVTEWMPLLIVRAAIALSLGGAVTLAYTVGGFVIPSEHRGAAFGWLAMAVQIGTASSPLATGFIASRSVSGAFLAHGTLAWLAAGLLVVTARGLLTRRAAGSVGTA